MGHIQFVLDFLYYSEPGNLYFSLLTAQMDLQELFFALFAVYQVTVTKLVEKVPYITLKISSTELECDEEYWHK